MKYLIVTAVFVALFSVCHGIIFSGGARNLLVKALTRNLNRRNCQACRDVGGAYCKNFGCTGKFMYLCAKTCGTCKSCEELGITPATSSADKKVVGRAAALEPPGCVPGCADQFPDFCPIYLEEQKCATYQFVCKKSCGVCVPCTNTGSSGGGQDSQGTDAGATADTSGASVTSGASGGKGGGSVKTSTSTAPARLPCTLDCRDSRPSCTAWGLQGHCNPQGAYPDTIVACQQTCKACRKCILPQPATIVNQNNMN